MTNGSCIILGTRPHKQSIETAVPLLGDIPLIGRLFRVKRDEEFVGLFAVQVIVEEHK